MPDPYVDGDTYRRATGSRATADPDTDLVLLAATEEVDVDTSVSPGMWAPIGSATYRFTGRGGKVLRLRDDGSRQCLLRSIDASGIAVDTDGDGVANYTIGPSDVILRSPFQETYRELELRDSAPIASWPIASDAVWVTGDWGCTVVPGLIQQLVVDVAHNLRQAALAGGIAVPTVDESLPVSSAAWPILRRVRERYSQRLPGIA